MLRVLLSLALALSAAPAAAAPPSYPLACAGGGEMGVEVGGDADGVMLRIRFQHGSRPATAGGLLPGQCAWSDRGMDPSEPTVLTVALRMRPRILLPAAGGRATYLGPMAASTPDAIQKFEALWNGVFQGGTFHVHARAAGDVLVITRVGP